MFVLALLEVPNINFEVLIDRVLTLGVNFYQNGTVGLALGIFWFCITFHLIQGAIEIVNGERSRLFNPKWWMRILLVLAMFGGYQLMFVNTIQSATKLYFGSFATEWVEIWNGQEAINVQQKTAATENRQLEEKTANDSTPSSGGESKGMFASVMYGVAAWGIGLMGAMFCTVAGMFLLIMLLLQGFFALALNTLIIAVGPIAIAFAAHEKTESIFWSWSRAWFVYGLLYLPLLGLGSAMAGQVFQVITSSITASGFSYQDGSDIAVHFILSVLGPIATIPMAMSVPAFVSGVFQIHAGTGGSTPLSAAVGAVAGVGASKMSSSGMSPTDIGAIAEGVADRMSSGGSGGNGSGGGTDNNSATEARG